MTTAEQIEQGIANAIGDREFGVVPSLIKLLAVKDPHRAQAVLDTLEIGLSIARDGDQ